MMSAVVRAGLVGLLLLTGSLATATAASADDRCTNQIDYLGDPRSNAEINSIGASSGTCPPPMTAGTAALPPGCDWNTDEGTQACMGGGPFDSGKNGNGDTYGPSGEAGFLYDTKLVLPSVRALNDSHLLKIGHQVCDNRRRGLSEDVVKEAFAGAFAKNGLDPDDAGYLVIDAQMYLCPDV